MKVISGKSARWDKAHCSCKAKSRRTENIGLCTTWKIVSHRSKNPQAQTVVWLAVHSNYSRLWEGAPNTDHCFFCHTEFWLSRSVQCICIDHTHLYPQSPLHSTTVLHQWWLWQTSGKCVHPIFMNNKLYKVNTVVILLQLILAASPVSASTASSRLCVKERVSAGSVALHSVLQNVQQLGTSWLNLTPTCITQVAVETSCIALLHDTHRGTYFWKVWDVSFCWHVCSPHISIMWGYALLI